MDDDTSTSSPLSLQSSDAFDVEEEHAGFTAMQRPGKRRKLALSYMIDSVTPPKFHEDQSISSDSEGDIPNSPGNVRPDEDDLHEQVTVCLWIGCDAGDLGDMDQLVRHIHNEHVETKAKRYTCEWSDCSRRSSTHASAYALRAHMRSHTKEKPFICELPECDRAFTRSDALQKHYRTVHETEALRPSDSIPKPLQAKQASQPASMNSIGGEAAHYVSVDLSLLNGAISGDRMSKRSTSFPPELGISEEKESLGATELYRLLRRQIHWADEEGEALKLSCEALEELRRKEWMDKEILFDQVLTIEQDWHERRMLVLAGSVDISATKASTEKNSNQAFATSPPHGRMPYSPSDTPGKSFPMEDQREAAAVLASMAQA